MDAEGYGWDWTDQLVADLRAHVPGLALMVGCDDRRMIIGVIAVPPELQGQGHGTAVLRRLCAEADARGLTAMCTPTDEYGADLDRLHRWYRRHGFAPDPQAFVSTAGAAHPAADTTTPRCRDAVASWRLCDSPWATSRAA